MRKVDECNENSQWLEDRNGRLVHIVQKHKYRRCDWNEYVSRKEFIARLRDYHMWEWVSAQKLQHTTMD